MLTETTIVLCSYVLRRPQTAFDYILLVEQTLRACIFATLIGLYFGLRNDKKRYDNVDAERQSLLRKKVAPQQLGNSSTANGTENGSGYGTTDTAATESDTAAESEAAVEEDSWLAEQRKAQEAISKRLKQDGNWFTYAKGFTVG